MDALAIAVVGIGLPLGYVFLVYGVDPDRDTAMSTVRRLLLEDTPAFLSRLLLRLCGPDVHKSTLDIFDYVLNKPNPLMQIVYLHLVVGGYALFLVFADPLIPNIYLAEYHKYCLPAAVLAAVISFLKASTAPAGKMWSSTVGTNSIPTCIAQNRNAQPAIASNQLVPNIALCATYACHDSIIVRLFSYQSTNFGVDCAWLNACVGELNYKYFIAFIGVNALILIYATYVLLHVLLGEVVSLQLFESKYVNQETGEPADATLWIVIRYVIYIHPVTSMLLFIAIVMGSALIAFFVFHIYLIVGNRTTNEFFKQWGMQQSERTKAKRFYNLSLIANCLEVIFPRCRSNKKSQ
ncbi:hypothetical protein LEN26_016142 [Aphanomyces euteiches]|nr:hypothetical protein LEN26_016142 [Aphanomyces euteiches]KAH9124610.1 hypothetical protein AeMF1_004662 [Aphanomyces euteiches]KAH9191794.1 hypothetical protein AeNC1_006231 [Aphanomyces euteiches]